jgi:hypothetical protein
VYNVHNNLPMNTLRIRNMFLLVTALAVMFLLACGSSEPEVPQVTAVPVATATSLTGQEAIGLAQQWLNGQTYSRSTTERVRASTFMTQTVQPISTRTTIRLDTKCPTNPNPNDPWSSSYSAGIWTVTKGNASWKVYDKTWAVVSNNAAC